VIHPDTGSVATHEEEIVLEESSIWTEITGLVHLAVPTIVIHLSFVVPPFLTASYIGRHFGYLYLSGYTLANLTGNLMTLALLQGLYNACDTLSPQAFGAKNYRQVGLLAYRGFVATIMVILPINAVLYAYMNPILQSLGQDEEAALYAWEFYMIYALSFPFYSIYTLVWKFLSAQNVLLPLVACTLFSTVLVLPLCLEFLVHRFGFLGAAWSITLFYVVESSSVVLWCWIWKPHHARTWPGFSRQVLFEALKWEPFRAYCLLGLGGMLASFEWVYWEALALIIGSLGVLPLSAHTVPTQIMFFAFMFPLGLGIALAIRLGATISHHVSRARWLAGGTMAFSVLLFGSSAVLMYALRWSIYRIFTNEDDVMELCDRIWFDVCVYFFVLSFFGVTTGVSIGLGMQWTLGIVTLVSLWCFGLPASYYFAVIRGGGLEAAWRYIWPPYIAINGYMIIAFVTKDWDGISAMIRIREGLEQAGKPGNDVESLALLESSEDDGRTQNGNGYGSIGRK